jgi:polyphosphate kinase 2
MAKKNASKNKPTAADKASAKQKLDRKTYEKELYRLQTELCKLQEWVKAQHKRIIIVFEGRDAAGKGGIIRRITERVSPRVFRVVALPAPSDREKSQLYMQRYLTQFPAAGEIVVFDRSWYNRAGVERVMGFCTDAEYERFLRNTPEMEHFMIESGIILIKYWLEVSNDEQERRFLQRIEDPTKQWKLSPMDLESRRRWYDYSKARDVMLAATDVPRSPWYIVRSDDKKRARLNCITHLLSRLPYEEVPHKPVKLPKRDTKGEYDYNAPMAGRNYIIEKF